MIRTCAALVLLDFLIQIPAHPGSFQDFYQLSNPKRSHWGHDWGPWDQQDWFHPRTTQRLRTRKTNTQELKPTTPNRINIVASTSNSNTEHTPPVYTDVEITTKDAVADISEASTRNRQGHDVSTVSDVTAYTTTAKPKVSKETQADDNTEDYKPFSVQEAIPFLSTEKKEKDPSSSINLVRLENKDGRNMESSSHWHVGIYKTTEMPYTQICGGSLIKTDKVLSAGHCFWTPEMKQLPPNQFAAAAGKLHRAWDHPDSEVQYSDISKIVTTRMFRPCLATDLALLTLATPFRYVGAVKPVCLEFADRENLTSSDKGLIAGWAVPADACKPSDRLIWNALPFVHTLNCSSETKAFGDWAPKICAGEATDKTQCESDSGSGLVFFKNSMPYLRGIATFVPDDSLCFIYSTPSFTPTGREYDTYDLHFEQLLKNLSSSECQDFYSTGNSGQLQSENQSEACLSGQLQITNEEVGNVTLNQNTSSVLPEEENILVALGTGSTPVPTLENTSAPAYQWHVGIYSKLFEPYMQICGGSLVKLDVVISAAHCFWDDAAGQQPASQFAVAGGKLFRPWNSTKDTYAQLSDVSQISIPVRFRGEMTSFQDDIAVVRLSAPFARAPGVVPACVDFGEALESQQLVGGNPGTVPGWGLTEQNGSPSQRLNYLELPYVEPAECFSRSEPGFLKYITSDKICAGDQLTGKALCRGDSGGGLVLFSGTTPYVRGVASTAPRNDNLCNAFAIATFTQIYAHRTFLRDNVPDIDKECIADPTGNGESGTATGNGAESGIATGNDAKRAPFSTGNVAGDRVEMIGNRVVTTTENGLRPPAFIRIEGPAAVSKTTPAPFEHSHLVPYNNFVCNCNCKN